jgi:soluble lytic murein transglycosylase-like protein
MYKHPLTPVEAKELSITAVELSKETGINLGLILGLIEIESKYERKAKSKKKCRGLTQLSQATADAEAETLGIDKYNIYSIKDNLTIGIHYLVDLYGEWHNWLDALTVYNMGFRNFASRGYRINGYAGAVTKRGKTIEKLLKDPKVCKSF